MQTIFQVADGDDTVFTVFMAIINGIQRGFKIEICNAIEWQSALLNIAIVLISVVRDLHRFIACTKNKTVNLFIVHTINKLTVLSEAMHLCR